MLKSRLCTKIALNSNAKHTNTQHTQINQLHSSSMRFPIMMGQHSMNVAKSAFVVRAVNDHGHALYVN